MAEGGVAQSILTSLSLWYQDVKVSLVFLLACNNSLQLDAPVESRFEAIPLVISEHLDFEKLKQGITLPQVVMAIILQRFEPFPIT